MKITLLIESILDQDVDAIVNPANPHLKHGGGLARIIADAADPEKRSKDERVLRWRKEHKQAPLVPTGTSFTTSAGVLPFNGIIHAVGPIWKDGLHYEPELLVAAYYNSIMEAANQGFKSVAFPAISAGIFGVPMNVVALSASQGLDKAAATQTVVEDVRICLMNDDEMTVFEKFF